MGVRELPSGRFQARVMVNKARRAATFDTRCEAEDWLTEVRAAAITGALPERVTVVEYTQRWLLDHRIAAPVTRAFHKAHLEHIESTLGPVIIGEVVPSDVIRMLNSIAAAHSSALAWCVYRTASAVFDAAAADGLCPRGSPVPIDVGRNTGQVAAWIGGAPQTVELVDADTPPVESSALAAATIDVALAEWFELAPAELPAQPTLSRNSRGCCGVEDGRRPDAERNQLVRSLTT